MLLKKVVGTKEEKEEGVKTNGHVPKDEKAHTNGKVCSMRFFFQL